MLQGKNITKFFGKKLILNDISLFLEKGTSTAIKGRNGAGKSTLLSILAGYLQPDKGQVIADGKIGYIPQQDVLFEELKVKDNIIFWAKASRQNPDSEMFKLFEIEAYQSKKVKELSGGMKKALSICCCLLHDPPIIIMDEPFTALDIYYKEALITVLKSLKERDKTLVYTSHNLDEMQALNSEIYSLEKGDLFLY